MTEAIHEGIEEKARKTRVTHRSRVVEVIHHMRNIGVKNITTDKIMEATGLSRGQVADAIKDLLKIGLIDQMDGLRGSYIPVESQPPSQAVSVTVLPESGGCKIEKGDQVMDFTPHEWLYILAPVAAGFAAQIAVMDYVNRNIALAVRVQKLEREVSGYKAQEKSDPRQLKMEV